MRINLFHNTKRICSNCGMSVPEGNMFCEECGAKYEPAAEPATKKSSTSSRMYCPNGHQTNNDGSLFCVECGTRLIEQEEIEMTENPPIGWTCSCGGTNDGSSVFCTNCGLPKTENAIPAVPVEKPAYGWMCSCGNTNDEDCVFCTSCGQRKPDEGVSTEKPVSAWICSCGGTNDEDNMFCISCGNRRISEPKTMSKVTESEKHVIEEPMIPNPKPNREIPAIPDIMRPLTNNDMMK